MSAGRDVLRWLVARAGVPGVLDMEPDILFAAPKATINRTCTADLRRAIRVREGAAGVADVIEICQKDAADAYVWTAF